MSAVGSKIDYSGRTVDLLLLKTILDVPAINKRVNLDVSNVHGAPMIVTGVEKMVQRFAVCFLNAIGSTRFMPNHGTNIIPRVAGGFVYDISTLEAEAAEANMVARVQVKEGDIDMDTPDDERLVDSAVVGLSFSREKARAEISIKLTTAAGDEFTYIIPVAVGVH